MQAVEHTRINQRNGDMLEPDLHSGLIEIDYKSAQPSLLEFLPHRNLS